LAPEFGGVGGQIYVERMPNVESQRTAILKRLLHLNEHHVTSIHELLLVADRAEEIKPLGRLHQLAEVPESRGGAERVIAPPPWEALALQ